MELIVYMDITATLPLTVYVPDDIDDDAAEEEAMRLADASVRGLSVCCTSYDRPLSTLAENVHVKVAEYSPRGGHPVVRR